MRVSSCLPFGVDTRRQTCSLTLSKSVLAVLAKFNLPVPFANTLRTTHSLLPFTITFGLLNFSRTPPFPPQGVSRPRGLEGLQESAVVEDCEFACRLCEKIWGDSCDRPALHLARPDTLPWEEERRRVRTLVRRCLLGYKLALSRHIYITIIDGYVLRATFPIFSLSCASLLGYKLAR